ncbi:MAG: DUF1269 domain-containing protein [Candidatus Obscuribacter sp.]|nr:DUF1269 domain-containing protein [Candidatus Obscuribacter sp.]MBK9278284.1 DUF1269 domain-containing protein [Candidatus Obscuribacter sp.]MBL8083573.1 DUF1269 domain-containing protein [Candidatus Obscuribacter sp.]
MSTLVVIGYDDIHKAQEMRIHLLKLQRDYLIDLEDAVVVERDAKGKIKLHQMIPMTAMGAMQGGFWGTLIGCLFFAPIFGMAVGAAGGAISGALADVGINDDFMKELGETLTPGKSALCVLIKQMTEDKVLDDLHGTGGKVLKTNLSKEDESKLQEALGTARKAVSETATAAV